MVIEKMRQISLCHLHRPILSFSRNNTSENYLSMLYFAGTPTGKRFTLVGL